MVNQHKIQWYAFTTRPRHEKMVSLALAGKGYENYLPTYEKRRIVSGRMKFAVLPLIPGYVFCRINPSDRLPILTIPGVCSLVAFGGQPAPVNESEMQSLMAVAASGLSLSPCSVSKPGDRVLIQAGPLKGVEGTIVSTEGVDHLVVSISLLQRALAVKVETSWVEPGACDSVIRTTVPHGSGRAA